MKPELSIIKSLVFAFSLVLAACAEETSTTLPDDTTVPDDTTGNLTAQCADGIDNDSDSLTDLNDPGCANAAINDESYAPVSSAHDAARANSYDDAWEAAWIANVKTILSTPVSGVTKTAGKVLQVGDSMTYTYAYGDWARHKTAATASDLDAINWMHAGVFPISPLNWMVLSRLNSEPPWAIEYTAVTIASCAARGTVFLCPALKKIF